MKVLWLTNTPCGSTEYLNIKYQSGGWMVSLEEYIKKESGVELGVCFFYNKHHGFKFSYKDVTYYPVKDKNVGLPAKVRTKVFHELYDTNIPAIKKVIDDFKPDVIQLFGTESGLGEIIKETNIPVIVHIQGLINPYLAAWYPKGISQALIDKHTDLKDAVTFRGFTGYYKLFKKMAVREEAILRSATYIFGRTEWDKRTVRIYNPSCTYVHCEEMLRPVFFERQWQPRPADIFKIVTTINPNMYKGVEIILETAAILKNKTNLKFEWAVVGVSPESQLVNMFEKLKGIKAADNAIALKGRKGGSEVLAELLNADVFIHPSHIDNSPNSVCEAMLLGMPVIAGGVGGVPSLIQHNENGILYNSYDPYELAGIILEKAGDRPGLNELGKNARNFALKRHDPPTIVSTILSTYAEVIKESLVQHASV